LSDSSSDTVAEHCYTLFGLTFISDVALHLPPGDPLSKPNFNLRAASLDEVAATSSVPSSADGDQWSQTRLLASGEYEVELTDWLRLRAGPDGRCITYRLHDTVDHETFAAHIANFAASMALLMQGEETLHSTVVWIEGRGIGLLGPSGAGKSTFAAYMLGLGGELVTDDLLRITETGNRLFAEPGPARLKLFAHTADRHFSHQWPRGKWNALSEKYLFPTAGSSEARLRRPLDALFLLAPPNVDSPSTISLERLSGLEVFKAISGSTMGPSFNPVDRLSRQFAFFQWIAKMVPVYSLSYPRSDEIFCKVFPLIQKTIS